ncbi:hypothetical protein G6031_05025 [Dietzia sp. CQ4]|uniref:hypothetical protein n=1 Tax=Dietzia sp. (strain CQ4) TaxID=370437 RepID=UPI0015F87FC7|nr:hypothetical protein [Dietzia sp. CQ4]
MGLVLGLGAVATLATFQDDTWVRGQFASIRGGIEGSIDSTNGLDGTWNNNFTSGSAAVMTVNPTANLLPGTTRYARFGLRTSSGVVNPATVTMTQGVVAHNTGSNAAMSNAVRIRAYTSANHSCNDTTTGQTGGVTYLLGGAGVYRAPNAAPTGTPLTLPAGTAGAAGAGRTVCFEFSLANDASSDAANGADFSVTWPFTTNIGT